MDFLLLYDNLFVFLFLLVLYKIPFMLKTHYRRINWS